MADIKNLRRSLTVTPATAVILANIIGTGVFVKARVMTCNVGSPSMVLAVWVFAGLLTMAGALVYAELGSMIPRSGGEARFLGSAFGDRWAFLYGWTKTVALGASAAATSILCVIFLNDLSGGQFSTLTMQLLPVLIIVGTVGINLLTVKSSGWFATALTMVKVLLVISIGVGAFFLIDGASANYAMSNGATGTCEGVPESAKLGIGGFGAAMLGALWGYNGWAILAAIGGEIKDPARTVPRALIGGTLLVIVLYLFINAAFFNVMTPLEIASVSENSSVAGEVAARVFGPGVAALLALGLAISAAGTTHTTILSGPRVPYALAKDGLLPKGVGYVNRAGVPAVAIIGVGAWSIVLAVSGTFDILTDIYVFVLWVFFAMNGVGLFVLRKKRPDAERPYKVWGYPVVPILFLITAAYLLINTLIVSTQNALVGVAFILVGLPLYSYFTRHRSTAASDSSPGNT
ncbi:MAG: amino acid permease [Pseudomonadota bacterium]